MHVLLVEPAYYTRFPPLGLLKLSTYYRAQGHTVELVRGLHQPETTPDLVCVTSLASSYTRVIKRGDVESGFPWPATYRVGYARSRGQLCRSSAV